MSVAPSSSNVMSISAASVEECEIVEPSPEQMSQPLLQRQPVRAALVVKSLLMTVCGGALLMTAAAVLDPSTLQAGSTAVSQTDGPDDQQQRVAAALNSLISRSGQILAVQNAREHRGAEILLWLNDTHDHGRIDADEIALIRHNPTFQTVTVYSVAPQSEAAQASAWAECDLAAPDFLDRWRSQASVQARVIGTGLSDLRIEPGQGSVPSALSTLRLHLTWTDHSADGGMHASTTIEVSGRDPSTAPGPMQPPSQQEYTP